MHELSAADAFRPSPVCILDLPLAEYSIGHELLLFRRRNALALLAPEEFSKLDFEAKIYAIREAVWICSDPFSARERFERPSVWMLGFRWNEWKRRRWVKRLQHLLPEDYALAAAEFRNYLAEAQSGPPVPSALAISILYQNEKDHTGRAFGQPMFLTLYHFVSSLPEAILRNNGCGGSPWDFPFARAMWLYFAKCEAEGAFRIENATERQVQAEWDQHNRDVAAEKAAEARSQKPEARKAASGLATPPPDLDAEAGPPTSDLRPPTSAPGGAS